MAQPTRNISLLDSGVCEVAAFTTFSLMSTVCSIIIVVLVVFATMIAVGEIPVEIFWNYHGREVRVIRPPPPPPVILMIPNVTVRPELPLAHVIEVVKGTRANLDPNMNKTESGIPKREPEAKLKAKMLKIPGHIDVVGDDSWIETFLDSNPDGI